MRQIVDLFKDSTVAITAAEAVALEQKYNHDGWRTERGVIRFDGEIIADTITVFRNQYGDGWEKEKSWDID